MQSLNLKHWKWISVIMIMASIVQNSAIAHDRDEELVKMLVEQLGDLKQELNLLSENVANLSIEIRNLRTSGVGQPTQPVIVRNPESVTLRTDTQLGNPQAKWAIVEFMDFQCPFCSRHAEEVLPRIREEYVESGKIRYVVRDFPLAFHLEAKNAAVAANCAGMQGKYWEMHDYLFGLEQPYQKVHYTAGADLLNLDRQLFETCLNDVSESEFVDSEFSYGNSVGVHGTPKFFIGRINGDAITDVVSIDGAQPFSVFKAELDRLIESE